MFTTVVLGMLFLLSIYPILGAFCWFIGALCYRFIYQHELKSYVDLSIENQPFISILVPAHNEEVMIEQTILYLLNKLNYKNYEVLVVDDGTTDKTPQILKRLQKKHKNLRVIRIEENKGKAHAFNIAISFTRGEYVLSNDADTVPEPDALMKYMNYFLSEEGKNYAAVTANMDVQNRSKIIEKSQTVEFSSIVGAIKRGQMATLGVMYAYSGANTMYRKSAVYDVGLFRQNRATEDISICWDQQFNGWKAVFAPEIMFYMNVPHSLKMLYQQRKRWAKGGTEVWLTNLKKVLKHPINNLSKVVMLTDQTFSIIWSFFYFITMFIFCYNLAYSFLIQNESQIIHMFDMAFIFITYEIIAGFFQLLAALLLDCKGSKLKYLFFAPFYMLFYWQMNALTIVTTFVPAVKTIMGFGVGTWKSPERVPMIDK
ncbi:glycosyltransferase family 2 protein [Enterococcus durans]|uniref:glycosyltransferase family 2 protein n=1 Tax=Enterococcus durans TaxID=53345 RepID=UPI0039A4F286